MSATHTPAEWVAYLFLGVGCWGAYATVWHLVLDLDAEDFHPRRLLAWRPARQAVLAGIAVLVMIGMGDEG